MSRRLITSAFAALLLTATSAFAAERPSTDETAIRLGVTAWSTFLKDGASSPDAESLSLFVKGSNLSARTSPTSAWLAASGSRTAQPTDVAVEVHGDSATVTLTLTADGAAAKATARVALAWQRVNGLWQIAREEVAPVESARVAAQPTP